MASDFKLDAIGQIHISVEDLPAAVAFYRDVLGMTLLFEVPGQQMAFFDCGGIRLYLGKPESPDFHSSPVVYYRVGEIDAAYSALAARGVEFEGAPHIVHKTEDTELWMAGFRDPDNNYLCLMSETPITGPAQ
ncbi:MAG: VOC family protein [Gemmatimonadetes bacterium]|nr:VOC family protein [Gemmatimonadota bacterium]